MQTLPNVRRVSGVFKSPIFFYSNRVLAPALQSTESHSLSIQKCCGYPSSSSFILLSGTSGVAQHRTCFKVPGMCFSTGVTATESSPTEAVKELYDKMLHSINVMQSAPPNAWFWSLIENCRNHEDIKLLYDVLRNHRRSRLSNLHIYENLNCNLCDEVAEACVCVGALDLAKKAMWKHNVYGLSPSVASAHPLLSYAEQHNDAKLLEEVMELIKENDLPLQPGTADIVFRICYKMDNWQLLSEHAKRFVKAGVKLRQATFDIWMEFAAKIGDIEALWRAEKLRSESMKQHSLASGFSCVKGFLLDKRPKEAAALVEILKHSLSEAERPAITAELGKLIGVWAEEVIKNQKADDREELAASLKNDIPAMVSSLLNRGLEMSVSLEQLQTEGAVPS